MTARPTDTTPEAAERQREILRGMSPTQRAETLDNLCELTRELSLQGIRTRHPEYSAAEARYALWRMMYGDALFCGAWPDAPLLPP